MQVPSYATNHKLHISNHNFANLKLQVTKKEGVLRKLVINGMKALSSSMKLLKRRKMRKTQKKPTKLTSIKKKLESKESSQ